MKNEVKISKEDCDLIITLLKILIIFNDDNVEVSMPEAITAVVPFDNSSETEIKEGLVFTCIVKVLTTLGVSLDDLCKELDGKMRAINKKSGTDFLEGRENYTKILDENPNKDNLNAVFDFIASLARNSYKAIPVVSPKENKDK